MSFLKENTCLRCGYSWLPRRARPKRCPRCGSYNWDKEIETKPERPKETHHSVINSGKVSSSLEVDENTQESKN